MDKQDLIDCVPLTTKKIKLDCCPRSDNRNINKVPKDNIEESITDLLTKVLQVLDLEPIVSDCVTASAVHVQQYTIPY